jgi:hypothetical protein
LRAGPPSPRVVDPTEPLGHRSQGQHGEVMLRSQVDDLLKQFVRAYVVVGGHRRLGPKEDGIDLLRQGGAVDRLRLRAVTMLTIDTSGRR